MDVFIIATAYYATLLIGISGIIIAVYYVLEKLYEASLRHFNVYNEFVRFVYDRHRKKRDVYTPKINRKEESE